VIAPARHTIRFANPADVDAVAQLLRAMDAYYGDPLPALGNYAAMAAATMTGQEGTRFVLGLHESEPVGLGCFAVLRPGQELKGLIFIKDLFVRAEWQGQGMGSALMRFIADFAVKTGIGRIDLATGQDNEGALKLYDRLGVVRQPAVYYNFPQSVIRKIAQG
jgi:GNAT superfamily N-acetyltransferase